MLQDDPLGELIAVVETLAPGDTGDCLTTLSCIAAGLARTRNTPIFGTCEDCRHFGSGDSVPYCQCMASAVAATDIPKICASFTPLTETGSLGERHGGA